MEAISQLESTVHSMISLSLMLPVLASLTLGLIATVWSLK